MDEERRTAVADCSALDVANTRNRKMTGVVKTKFEERRSRAVRERRDITAVVCEWMRGGRLS